MEQQTPEQELAERRRLPTLLEVLGRRTLAPVDLFSFYIYMRDQQRSVDYLDFWLVVLLGASTESVLKFLLQA